MRNKSILMHMTISKLKVNRLTYPSEVGWNAEDLAPLIDLTKDRRRTKLRWQQLHGTVHPCTHSIWSEVFCKM